jgi:protoporphyrinogen/coproporphyrinogen III oxidase
VSVTTAPEARRTRRIVVVGGGIAGLTTAERLVAAGNNDVTLLDADTRAGGVIRSERRDGFLCEAGPQALLSGRPDTKALVTAAGLDSRVIWSRDVTRRRFVFVRGALRALPTSPPALLKTDLLGGVAKLRLAREPFVAKGDPTQDESVLAFFERRFGAEAARHIGAPAVIGIYAGDAANLSVKHALPRLYELEQRHGSVLRGAMASRGRGDGPPRSFSFPEGLEELPRALAAGLGDRRVVARVVAIERASTTTTSSGYRVVCEAGPTVEADVVVVTTPAPVTAALVASLAPAAAAALRAVPFAPLAVTALGFRSGATGPASGPDLGMDLAAYGFVVARGEGVSLLGCQYESSIFEGRAPAGAVLLRALQGGTFEPRLVEETDDALAARAVADLRRVAGLRAEPDFVAVWRHPAAIPQYDLGHGARVRALDDELRRLPGLHVIGQATSGVGLNDGIAAAAGIARTIG